VILKKLLFTTLLAASCVLPRLFAETGPRHRPVNPNATPEAVALLDFLYGESGHHTLAGQHCNPLVGSTRLVNAFRQTKHYPALFGQDFGFSAPGTWDGINFRQNIVDEAIRRSSEGFIITLMWHAVRPSDDEPVEFASSIQGKFSDQQWQELLTPGSNLNERWKSQVDVIAWYLRQLQDAGVPVLWRPYHEMNGEWFWWGHRRGENGYRKLYRMLYDRLVNFHHLNNLLWVFNANEVRVQVDEKGVDHSVHPYSEYYPGADVVDVLATDVYQSNFAGTDYQDLLALADGKPIALGEVGHVPSPEVLRQQPRWSWFMLWHEPVANWKDHASFVATYTSAEVLTLDELPWSKVKEPRTHYPILK
jgi:mannan endo-1,4-beta-mannosidase